MTVNKMATMSYNVTSHVTDDRSIPSSYVKNINICHVNIWVTCAANWLCLKVNKFSLVVIDILISYTNGLIDFLVEIIIYSLVILMLGHKNCA